MSVTTPDTAYPVEPIAPAAVPSLLGRSGRAVRMFLRRSPMSAFWGCIAAGIIVMAIAAPVFAP